MNEGTPTRQSVIRKYHRKCRHHNLKRNYHHFSKSMPDYYPYEDDNKGHYGNMLSLVMYLPFIPFCVLFYIVLTISKKVIKRAYYHYNRNKNVIACGGRIVKVRECSSPSDVVTDKDGKLSILDEAEIQHREYLKHERRKIRHHRTINHEPTPEEVMERWQNVKRSYEDMLRFGSILCDLEAYVDNSIIKNEKGDIVGRQSGIKGWLRMHCPDIERHYSRAMRFKALTIRFRQILKIYEPYPATIAIDCDEAIIEAMRRPNPLTGEISPMDDNERTRLSAKINWEKVAAWRKQAIELINECETKAPAKKNTNTQNTDGDTSQQTNVIEISDTIPNLQQSNVDLDDVNSRSVDGNNTGGGNSQRTNTSQRKIQFAISDTIPKYQQSSTGFSKEKLRHSEAVGKEVDSETQVVEHGGAHEKRDRVVIAWFTKVLESYVDPKGVYLKFVRKDETQFA